MTHLSLSLYLIRYSLAIKNAEDNGPTRRDPASSELLCDGEQYEKLKFKLSIRFV